MLPSNKNRQFLSYRELLHQKYGVEFHQKHIHAIRSSLATLFQNVKPHAMSPNYLWQTQKNTTHGKSHIFVMFRCTKSFWELKRVKSTLALSMKSCLIFLMIITFNGADYNNYWKWYWCNKLLVPHLMLNQCLFPLRKLWHYCITGCFFSCESEDISHRNS